MAQFGLPIHTLRMSHTVVVVADLLLCPTCGRVSHFKSSSRNKKLVWMCLSRQKMGWTASTHNYTRRKVAEWEAQLRRGGAGQTTSVGHLPHREESHSTQSMVKWTFKDVWNMVKTRFIKFSSTALSFTLINFLLPCNRIRIRFFFLQFSPGLVAYLSQREFSDFLHCARFHKSHFWAMPWFYSAL